MAFLPTMKTDITLCSHGRVLIIDAKYYSRMQRQYDKSTVHSVNLYQMLSYVKNRDAPKDGSVSGLLLYAKTDEAVTPDSDVVLDGSRIGVKILDLCAPFQDVARQLKDLMQKHLLNPISGDAKRVEGVASKS